MPAPVYYAPESLKDIEVLRSQAVRIDAKRFRLKMNQWGQISIHNEIYFLSNILPLRWLKWLVSIWNDSKKFWKSSTMSFPYYFLKINWNKLLNCRPWIPDSAYSTPHIHFLNFFDGTILMISWINSRIPNPFCLFFINEISLKNCQHAPNVNVWKGTSQSRSRKGTMDRILQARGTNSKIYVPEKRSGRV